MKVTIAVRAASSAAQGIDHVTLGVSPEGPKRPSGVPTRWRSYDPPFSATQIRLARRKLSADRDGLRRLATWRSRVGFKAASITRSVPNDCSPGQRCEMNVCVTTPPLLSPAPAGMMDDGCVPTVRPATRPATATVASAPSPRWVRSARTTAAAIVSAPVGLSVSMPSASPRCSRVVQPSRDS